MATALLEQQAPATAPPHGSTSSSLTAIGQCLLPPTVLLLAVALSIWVYAYFWQDSRHLWWWINHDRHSHYMYGLDMAMDLRSGEFARLIHDFDRIRTWGPLHPVLVALIELVGGPEHRLAVLPSLFGWVITIWFAFLIPRRMLANGGNAAGLLAAFMVAVSPAHRAFATDVMYESLGAGLSLAALYCYLVTLQDRSPRWAIMLGVTLTILFLHKSNYWILVVLGLIGGEFVRSPRAWIQFALSRCQRDRLPSWLMGELKHPANYVMLIFAVAAVVIRITGGGTIKLAGRQISVQEWHNFIHLAYAAFFVRLCLWWLKTGRAWSLQWPATLRNVLLCHGGAVALWFLLPKRLSYFFFYMSLANNDQHRDSLSFMHGLPFYIQGLRDDYLTLTWGIYLFAAMLALGFLWWRQLQPGSASLLCFFLIATCLASQHPMLKNRFMHSWIAVGFVIGAVGLIQTAQQFAGFCKPGWRNAAAWSTCVLVVGLMSPAVSQPGHAQEGGIKFDRPTALVVPETYLDDLADADHPTIFCNVSTRFLLTWTFVERHHHQRFTADVKNYKMTFENNPQQIRQWLDTTRSDTLVVIDIHEDSPFFGRTDEFVDLTSLKAVLSQQTTFTERRNWEHAERFTVTLWKKN